MDGQCPECGVVEAHSPDCRRAAEADGDRDVKARLSLIRQDRDRKLAALQERHLPRLKAEHDAWQAGRDEIWAEYDQRKAELLAEAA